jgi:hypothetical protein
MNKIVVWSRSFDEYKRFFQLTKNDLKKKILCAADGASSFNAEASKQNAQVTSFDPIYQLSPNAMLELIYESRDYISPKVLENKNDYVWNYFNSPEHLCDHRMSTMLQFLEDYKQTSAEHRYVPTELPAPAFQAQSFDLVLVSHLLFLYSEQLSLEFHIQSIENLLIIANEVRIYPLHCNLGGISPYLDPVIEFFKEKEFLVQLISVDYEVAKGSNKMLKIARKND